MVLNVVDLLTKYTNNEITYKNFYSYLAEKIKYKRGEFIWILKIMKKIELVFEEFGVILPNNIIEKFQITKVEQLIEKNITQKMNIEVYIVINRILAEDIWKKSH